MDTRMLDVAIGLVLTIALVSLVATAAREAFAAMRNSRGKNLVRLVCSLAGDNAALAQQILAHPFFQSMAMERSRGKPRDPSYLPSDVFVSGLLDFLTRYTGKVRPASPAVLVQELRLRMTEDKDQKFSTSLASLLPGAENDWPVFEKRLQAWFDAVGERSSGWYKRENQVSLFLIGLLLAVAINVNPVVISRSLWNDAALRESAVRQAQLALQAYGAGELAGTAGTGNGTVASAAVAAASPLRRETDKALNTIDAVFKAAYAATTDAQVPASPRLLAAMKSVVVMRNALARERATPGGDPKLDAAHDAAVVNVDFALGDLRSQVPQESSKAQVCGPGGYLPCHAVAPLNKALGELGVAIKAERGVRDPRQGDQATLAILTSRCDKMQADTPSATRALCDRLRELGVFMPAGLPIGWSADAWPAVFECRKAARQADGTCPTWGLASVDDIGNWSIALAGWLLTALGVTLGAPFWFDMLGKLMKVRSSGVKPVEGNEAPAAGTGPAPAPSTLTPSGQAAGEGGRPGPIDALNDAERALSEDEITRIQGSLGVEATRQTGRLDLSTRSAIAVWQTRYGAAATGQLTQAQIQQLLSNPITLEDDGYVG